MIIKYVSSREMAKIDRIAVEYGLSVQKMMENAGRNVARFVLNKLKPKKVVVLYGKGNNGGDGVAAARFLGMHGVNVTIVPASKEVNKNLRQELKIISKTNIEIINDVNEIKNLGKSDVIIDALLGYNINGNPKGKYGELINWANESKARIVSFDLPSGMDPDTGECYQTCINADYTLTLALPFKGFKNVVAKENLGKLYLVNLGIPNSLFNNLGVNTGNYFRYDDVIKI